MRLALKKSCETNSQDATKIYEDFQVKTGSLASDFQNVVYIFLSNLKDYNPCTPKACKRFIEMKGQSQDIRGFFIRFFLPAQTP